MPNKRTSSRDFTGASADVQEDIGAKGGPSVGLGTPDAAHDVEHPYDSDLQTQIAAKARKKTSNTKAIPAKRPVK